MSTQQIDRRISKWIERANKLSQAFHHRFTQDAQIFLDGNDLSLRAAESAMLLTQHNSNKYGLSYDQHRAFQSKARETFSREQLFTPRLKNLGAQYRQVTELAPKTHFMTFVRPENTLDLLFFRYVANKEGNDAPEIILCDSDTSRSITTKIIERDDTKLDKEIVTDFETNHATDNNPIESHTVCLGTGKQFTLSFFDGYGVRGRMVQASDDASGMPYLSPLEVMRS